MRRLVLTPLVAALTLALLAPVALAGDEGQGFYGETDDKVVTFAGFILIAAVPLFILVMSILQWRLDRRKQARMAAKRASSARPEWRGGW